MTHLLKSWQGSFEAVASRAKTYEVRNCDREFAVGDTLILQEFIPSGQYDIKSRDSLGTLTGRTLMRTVSYITVGGSWGLPKEVCVLSIK